MPYPIPEFSVQPWAAWALTSRRRSAANLANDCSGASVLSCLPLCPSSASCPRSSQASVPCGCPILRACSCPCPRFWPCWLRVCSIARPQSAWIVALILTMTLAWPAGVGNPMLDAIDSLAPWLALALSVASAAGLAFLRHPFLKPRREWVFPSTIGLAALVLVVPLTTVRRESRYPIPTKQRQPRCQPSSCSSPGPSTQRPGPCGVSRRWKPAPHSRLIRLGRPGPQWIAIYQFQYVGLSLPVQGSCRFVEQEYFRFLCQTAGDGGALLLSAGKMPDGALRQMRHAHHFQRFIDDLPVMLCRAVKQSQKTRTSNHDYFADGHRTYGGQCVLPGRHNPPVFSVRGAHYHSLVSPVPVHCPALIYPVRW